MEPATGPACDSATPADWLAFTLPERDVRGRLARLGPQLDAILSAHDYPPELARCLAEALVLTALLGTLLKEADDQLTMQAQSEDGAVRLMVCDYRQGQLRGYLEPAPAMADRVRQDPSPASLFAGGYLAITFDMAGTRQRYQGIVPLTGASLAGALEYYFAQSEQLPTLVRTAIVQDHGQWLAGGLLLQHLPQAEAGRERLHARSDHPDWEHVALLADTIRVDELVDRDLPLANVVWRLFHEEREIRLQACGLLERGCRCSPAHFEAVLARFPSEQRREMANDAGIIVIDCAFCSRQFQIPD